MSMTLILRTTLFWHVRKARRVFELLVSSLAAPQGTRRTGVRWG